MSSTCHFSSLAVILHKYTFIFLSYLSTDFTGLTIPLGHIEHSGPDVRSHCDDLRRSGTFTQTVTPTVYEPKIYGTEEVSGASPEDLEPKRIEFERCLETDLYCSYHKQEGFMGENHRNTITEDVKVPNSIMLSEKSYIQSQMHEMKRAQEQRVEEVSRQN